MALFFTLLPFAVLSALLSVASPAIGLFTAALMVVALIAYDRHRGRALKLLQVATLVLTAGLGLCALIAGPSLTSHAARIALDTGLLLVMLGALALRFPFTIQYARENVADDIAARPEFLRTNYVMTWVWTAAMVLMLVADIGSRYVPWMPLWAGLAAAFVARNGAAWFTRWYAARHRRFGEQARMTQLARNAGEAS